MAAAALAYLVLHQQDSVGLVTFDNQVRSFLQPSSQPSHLKEMVHVHEPGLRPREDAAGADLPRPGRAHQPPRHRSSSLSDLFDDVADMLAGLKHLRHKRHEVVVCARPRPRPSWTSRSRKRRCSAAWSSTPSC